MSEVPDISTLRLSPEQWEFIKGEEEKRTKIAAEQARDTMRFQAKVMKLMAEPKVRDLRDMFAAQALIGMMQAMRPYSDDFERNASAAYDQADAMLRARGELMSEIPDRVSLGEIMEQAQVFASAWALLGSRFDDGSKLLLSQDEKDNLEVMVGMMVDQAILAERERSEKAARYAENLAVALHGHYYPENKQWKPLSGDLVGLLTQIDNMTVGLVRKGDA